MRRQPDIDTLSRTRGLWVGSWSLVIALVGAVVGGILAVASGVGPLWGAIPGFVAGGGGFYGTVSGLAEATARGIASFLLPSGRSTPRVPEHSYAESLFARGLLEEGVVVLRADAEEAPDNPAPRLRLARAYRDRLGDYEEAVTWFRRVRECAARAPRARQGEQAKTVELALRELVELLASRMNEPARALPDLARFAEEAAGTPAGEWAERELSVLRLRAWE